MARPSRNIDRKLLDTARTMLGRSDIADLSIRDVARKAGVNLGMFHYHFKSKRAFTRRLLQEVYEDFFNRLTLETSKAGSPMERLRRALLVAGKFTRDNRPIFLSLLRGGLHGQRETIEFAAKNVPRHLAVVFALLQECQAAGVLKTLPPPIAVSVLFGSISVPTLVIGMLETAKAEKPFGMPLSKLEDMMLSDAALEQRVDLALKALLP